ncbi:MAG: amino acid ABC transporter substrate-binding protein [Desulfobacterales bacterium]|nr:amino acid ABC transporter substrate-binding protein [Desulfobacterales bacterium]
MKYIIVTLALITMLGSGITLAADFSTLEQVKKTKKIRIGYRADKPPMSFVNRNNELVGYSIDLCLRMVDEMKSTLEIPDISVEYVPVNASNRFDALTDNKIDILCGVTTKTISRSEIVDFTQPTFVTGAALLTLKTLEVQNISELSGKKIAVVKDTTTFDSLTKMLKREGSDAEVVTVKTAVDGMNAVTRGEVDAFSGDQIVLVGLIINSDNPKQFALTENVFSFEPFALAVRKNDSEFRLVADRMLSRLYRTKKVLLLYDKWFGSYIKKMPTLLEAMYLINSTPE